MMPNRHFLQWVVGLGGEGGGAFVEYIVLRSHSNCGEAADPTTRTSRTLATKVGKPPQRRLSLVAGVRPYGENVHALPLGSLGSLKLQLQVAQPLPASLQEAPKPPQTIVCREKMWLEAKGRGKTGDVTWSGCGSSARSSCVSGSS